MKQNTVARFWDGKSEQRGEFLNGDSVSIGSGAGGGSAANLSIAAGHQLASSSHQLGVSVTGPSRTITGETDITSTSSGEIIG